VDRSPCDLGTDHAGAHTAGPDPHGIADDAQGNRRQEDQQPSPDRDRRRLGDQCPQGKEGIEGTDAAAGLRDLQAPVGQMDHVPLRHQGNPDRLESQDRALRRERLHRARYAVVDDVGKGYGEKQKREREGYPAQLLPAAEEQD